MKTRKNLERAIVLGLLLSTSVYGNVWAEDQEFEYGLKFNTGIKSSDYAQWAENSIYNLGDKNTTTNYIINKEGIILGSNDNLGELVKEVNIKTNGKIDINKSKKYTITSDPEGAIDLVVNRNFNATIKSDNININNVSDPSKHYILYGINMKADNGYINKLDFDIGKDFVIKDFDFSIHVEDNSILNIDARNINIVKEKADSVSGIYYRYGKNSEINFNATGDINFINTSNPIFLQGENLKNNLSAKNNIKITTDKQKTSGIQSSLETDAKTGCGLNTILNAGNNIEINNYKYGLYLNQNIKNNSIDNVVTLKAGKEIYIHNVETGIYVTGSTSNVNLDVYEESELTKNSFERNNINKISADKTAVYAGTGGIAEINGAFNTLQSTRYRTIQASGGDGDVNSQININGGIEIINRYASIGLKTNRIAVVASADEYNNAEDAIGGIVNINLNGTGTKVDNDGKFIDGNRIVGSVIAGKNGIVNINSNLPEAVSTLSRTGEVNKGSIAVYGNVMAGNNGELNLDLGEGGYLSGRVDDYQDAAVNGKHETFFNPEFSKDITDSGTVNLTMGKDSTWDVTGQSWVTKLEGSGTVDMRNGGANDTSHAVHIGTLTGDHTFVMDLDSDNHNVSDMLFIKDEADSQGKQTIYLNSVAGLDTMADGEKLRFATVNAETDKLSFVGVYNGENGYNNNKNRVMLMDNGVMNTDFVIEYEKYDATDAKNENEDYNGGTDFNAVKPGDGYVDTNYANGTNWYLTRNKAGDETSDAGKTIINMSKVNYSNAIYMDRLNKRLGEARYINPEEEQGMWVRIRHDRIGKDDAFRSQNTMYEMGYDEKQEVENGERRLGFAIDYMDGKAEYTGIAGDGDVKRYGLWLYDTWMGDKGHYTDYVLKWGHLENDFDVYTMTRNEKVTGDYSNNVFSASAEYGKKNDMGNGWYFEPQAQLQLARVTGADYTTSQNTKVSLDGINSLIGRAGFRLGRDINENSTVYIKADLLHEFLGDQTITATDGTGTLREEYENEGTWYDVGFGFATALSNNSYAFMDFEKSFGNDNDETYQINAGVQWTF